MTVRMDVARDAEAFAGLKGLVVLVRITHPSLSSVRLKVTFADGKIIFKPDGGWPEPVEVTVPDGVSVEAAVASHCAAAMWRRSRDTSRAAEDLRLRAQRAADDAEAAADEAARFQAYAAHVGGATVAQDGAA